MELLVVLLIIGILSTVALQTIDATRDRSLFDQTTKEMDQLVQAMVGNPDLAYDGRRVDFGYYGDMEQLPPNGDLRDLVVNRTGSPHWHGPYLRMTAGAVGVDTSYLYDGWGRLYGYNSSSGEIHTMGNGKFDMTVKVVDSIVQLDENVIAGTVTDIDGAAPGDTTVSRCSLKLYYNNPAVHGNIEYAGVLASPGGYYEISYTPAGGSWKVPIGTHKLVASTATESIVRYVTVLPRSKTVVDFKFTSSFWNKLRMVGAPIIDDGDSAGFIIKVVNDQSSEIQINSLSFFSTPASAFMRSFRIDTDHAGYPILDGLPGTGPGDTVDFSAPVTIAPHGAQIVEIAFQNFKDTEVYPPGAPFKVHGQTFQFRFSDGSEITVKP